MTQATILFIEDDLDVLMAATMILEIKDYRVVTASSAEEALSVFNHEIPDAILLDLHLPGMDGWGFLQQLRGMGRFPITPVIIVSGDAKEEVAKQAKEWGCFGFITKPFKVNDLCNKIEEALGRG